MSLYSKDFAVQVFLTNLNSPEKIDNKPYK
jgi:hypothetical protein